MNRDHVRFLVSGILFGFLVGYVVAYGIHEPRVKGDPDPVPQAGNLGMTESVAAAPAGGGAPGAEGAPVASGPGAEAMMAQVFQQVGALKEAIQKNPKDADALIHLANFYQDAGKYDQAVDYYQQGLAVRPEDVDARTDLGICLRELGKTDEAMAQFRKSVELNPNHWQTWLNMAVVSLFDRHDPETAASALGHLEALNPSFKDLPMLKEAIRKARSEGKPAGS
jgi:tetratricopeptide (TPR) repeat protein